MLDCVKVVFNKIKNHFELKKTNANFDKECYYLVQFADENGFYVIEQKILLSAFLRKTSIHDFLYNSDVQYLGWHLGKDSRFYQKFALKEAGVNNYNKSVQEDFGWEIVDMLTKALTELVENKKPLHLTGAKKYIKKIFNKSEICAVGRYERKEFANEEESQKEIEQSKAFARK